MGWRSCPAGRLSKPPLPDPRNRPHRHRRPGSRSPRRSRCPMGWRSCPAGRLSNFALMCRSIHRYHHPHHCSLAIHRRQNRSHFRLRGRLSPKSLQCPSLIQIRHLSPSISKYPVKTHPSAVRCRISNLSSLRCCQCAPLRAKIRDLLGPGVLSPTRP